MAGDAEPAAVFADPHSDEETEVVTGVAALRSPRVVRASHDCGVLKKESGTR